jgi:hypothetical protein
MKIEPHEEEELLLLAGDLLICEGGEPGRCAIWRDSETEMFFQKALHRLRPFPEALPEYLAINLNLDARTGVLDQYFTGATIKHLTGRSLARYPIPLPPVEEQQRIVAKVDELMALCDKLESQERNKNSVAEAFSQAAVTATTGSAEEPKLMKAPQIELVTRLELDATRNRLPGIGELLASLLAEHEGALTAKALWQRSGLAIDAFYQQLKTEMAAGWILEPEPAQMREVASD